MRGGVRPDADVGNAARELGDAAGAIAHRRHKPTEPAVGGQTSLQTPAEHRRVDVAAAQRYHHPEQHDNARPSVTDVPT